MQYIINNKLCSDVIIKFVEGLLSTILIISIENFRVLKKDFRVSSYDVIYKIIIIS